MEKTKIRQVEPRFAQELETPLKATLKKLGYSIPESFRLRVSLLNANGRKKRSNAGADTWAPESERMEVPPKSHNRRRLWHYPHEQKLPKVPVTSTYIRRRPSY